MPGRGVMGAEPHAADRLLLVKGATGRIATLRRLNSARHHRRLTAWIALFAMLAFALVPTLSRAMSHAQGNSAWAEVCTPQGLKLVALGNGEQAPVQANGHHLDHCAFCGLAGDGAAPWPSLPPTLPTVLAGTEVPRLFLQAAHTPFAWRSAPARAPPIRS